MIAQFLFACKAHVYDCVQKDIHFQTIYDDAVEKALSPGSVIVIPDTGERYTYGAARSTNGEKTPSIKKDGRYPRNVIDVYMVRNKGKISAHFYSDQIQMQNLEASSGHHHALHTNQLAPYVTLTTNACFYVLYLRVKCSDLSERADFSYGRVDYAYGTSRPHCQRSLKYRHMRLTLDVRPPFSYGILHFEPSELFGLSTNQT